MELLELWETVTEASNCTYTQMFRPPLLFEAALDNSKISGWRGITVMSSFGSIHYG